MKKVQGIILGIILIGSLSGFIFYMVHQPHITDDPSDTEHDQTDPFSKSSINASLQQIFPVQSFSFPTGIYFHDSFNNTAWVVELAGKIKEINLKTGENITLLNIKQKIGQISDEEGLVGFAFDPEFSSNGLIYVHYTTAQPLRTYISRFNFTGNIIDPTSERIMIQIIQPYANHNGGGLVFGTDDMLYVGLGDGGLYYDPHRHGQNRSNFFSTILRINPTPTTTANYTIPNDNPYVNNTNGYREEIYAYGLRNPYRMSIDSTTGELIVGDVGQDDREEVNIIEAGGNYGWSIFEGTLCLQKNRCDSIDHDKPIYEYTHTQGDAIIGGIVYRGSAIPELGGQYIFADWLSGYILTLSLDNPIEALLLHEVTFLTAGITSDTTGELYFCAFDGSIYKLV